jgi:hypothetical protein
MQLVIFRISRFSESSYKLFTNYGYIFLVSNVIYFMGIGQFPKSALLYDNSA